MRRAWIEMSDKQTENSIDGQVALHAESVDRNFAACCMAFANTVALHAESVDRNWYISPMKVSKSVALHAESVDRKNQINHVVWLHLLVALHAESVDRNICILGRSYL